MLSCRVGVKHVDDIEDAVQSALMSAIGNWTINGIPSCPSAWLFRVANNNLKGDLRQQTRRRQILEQNASKESATEFWAEDVAESVFSDEVEDELLRMMFISCDEAIPLASQLVFTLKTLCGFDVREIAIRLFTSEANVYKRLTRARNRLRELHPKTEAIANGQSKEQLSSRLPAVYQVLYLLFTEGYLSSNAEIALRRELCDEAIRLTTILATHPVGQLPETYALLALMHLHAARLCARQDGVGGLLLLEEQDRGTWNQKGIQQGLGWLAKSAEGETFSRYHAEAGIAAEHCLAPSFAETRWNKVAEYYELVERSSQSPLHKLNRAVAVAEWKGPAAGLAILQEFEPPTWLAGSFMWSAVLSDLHRRCGHDESAERYREIACNLAPNPQVMELLRRRLHAQ